MAFSYYKNLTRPQKRIYRESDLVTSIRLPGDHRWSRLIEGLGSALSSEDPVKTETGSQNLISLITASLKVVPVRVVVKAKRPSRQWGELHGLYELSEGQRAPQLTVWMRTAQRRQVVAYRTFLRTLLHELGHHLDYTLLELADSFHTEGFYKRESSLLHQLLPKPTAGNIPKKK